MEKEEEEQDEVKWGKEEVEIVEKQVVEEKEVEIEMLEENLEKVKERG